MKHQNENFRLNRTQTIETLHKQTMWFSREQTGKKKRVLACIADGICPVCGNDLFVNEKFHGATLYECYACEWHDSIECDH